MTRPCPSQVKGRGLSRTKVYAQMAGIGYDRLVKMLRGEVIMRLEDVAAADRLLGGISGFTRTETPTDSTDRFAATLLAADMGSSLPDDSSPGRANRLHVARRRAFVASTRDHLLNPENRGRHLPVVID
jgi:hypothetical protein